ncbi:MAG TPA: hypothetical protein VHL32_06025 [Gemmatimonadaceae bacterium]|nr:hypothetical protein [Gemmatimonadaceae bacterium]
MQRSWVFRAFATVMGVWLAICLAEPLQLHTCVMHGGLAIDVAGHHGEMGSASSHPTPSEHHAQMASHSAGEHGQRGQSDHHARQCSCLGDCNAGKTPVVLASAAVNIDAPMLSRVDAVYDYASPSLVAPHFLLPFSNGPPASSRA